MKNKSHDKAGKKSIFVRRVGIWKRTNDEEGGHREGAP